MSARAVLFAIPLLLTGCATRHTAPAVYRLVHSGPTRILIPPGVSDSTLATRTFDFKPLRAVPKSCANTTDALRVQPRRGLMRITVQRDLLLSHPAPWLADWTFSLEQQHCLSPAESTRLAEEIVESVPLNPAEAYRLLHPASATSGFLDLANGFKLRLVSPILRDGAPPGASALSTESVSGSDSKLSLTVKASSDFLGYEISWYTVEGVRLSFTTAESHIGDQVVTTQRPRTNYFAFPETSRYYRLFYFTRVSQADHNVAIVSAPAREELARRTVAFAADPTTCGPECVALPREVAVTTYLTVMGNGVPLQVPVESTVADALRAAIVARPATVLPTLTVRRSYRGVPVPIEFDRNQQDILTLPLTGTEDLRW